VSLFTINLVNVQGGPKRTILKRCNSGVWLCRKAVHILNCWTFYLKKTGVVSPYLIIPYTGSMKQ